MSSQYKYVSNAPYSTNFEIPALLATGFQEKNVGISNFTKDRLRTIDIFRDQDFSSFAFHLVIKPY